MNMDAVKLNESFSRVTHIDRPSICVGCRAVVVYKGYFYVTTITDVDFVNNIIVVNIQGNVTLVEDSGVMPLHDNGVMYIKQYITNLVDEIVHKPGYQDIGISITLENLGKDRRVLIGQCTNFRKMDDHYKVTEKSVVGDGRTYTRRYDGYSYMSLPSHGLYPITVTGMVDNDLKNRCIDVIMTTLGLAGR